MQIRQQKIVNEQYSSRHKVLYIVDTPFQIAVSICDLYSSGIGKADIAIYGQFTDANIIAHRLKESSTFNKVFYINPYIEHERNWNIKYYIRSTVFPKRSFKRFLEAASDLHSSGEYTDIRFCAATPIVHDIRLYCGRNDTNVVLLEDGSGLYNYSVINDMAFLDRIVDTKHEVHGFRRVIKQLVNACTFRRYQLGINEVHGFKQDVLRKMYPNIYVRGITLSSQASNAMLEIFCDSNTEICEDGNCYLLTLPEDVPERVFEIEREIISQSVSNINRETVLRLHPRLISVEKLIDGNTFSRGLSISKGGLWEAYCLSGAVSERTILVGFGSTAQTTPKELCSIEPYVVFLPLILPEDYHARKSLIEVAKNYLDVVEDKSRVFLPESINEYTEIIKRLVENERN